MTEQTPYQSPDSELIGENNDVEFADVELFSLTQRIGRIRYMAYGTVSIVIITLVVTAIGASFGALSISGSAGSELGAWSVIAILALLYGPLLFVMFVLARRRLHDIGTTGWLGILLIIPFINLLFTLFLVVAPGTKGENKYGKQPKKNSVILWIIGMIGPIVFIGGMLAAIAIPAYQDYVERSQAAMEER